MRIARLFSCNTSHCEQQTQAEKAEKKKFSTKELLSKKIAPVESNTRFDA